MKKPTIKLTVYCSHNGAEVCAPDGEIIARGKTAQEAKTKAKKYCSFYRVIFA